MVYSLSLASCDSLSLASSDSLSLASCDSLSLASCEEKKQPQQDCLNITKVIVTQFYEHIPRVQESGLMLKEKESSVCFAGSCMFDFRILVSSVYSIENMGILPSEENFFS